MKTVLIYYPSNKRTNVIETIAYSFKEKGYRVLFLTTCEKGALHKEFEANGIKSYSNHIEKKASLFYYIRQVLYLIRFCRKNKIDFLHSHLQHANFIASFASKIISAKTTIFRHHGNFSGKDSPVAFSKNQLLFDVIIDRLASKIVVPSDKLLASITADKRFTKDKYIVLPYIYDFSKFDLPDHSIVEGIRKEYSCDFLFIISSRLIPLKRPLIAVKVVEELRKTYNVKLLVMDEGELKGSLEEYVTRNKLEETVFFIGFKSNFIDYYMAADVLLHPSCIEASNSTVKEFAFLEKVIVACDGVGDFNDYLINDQNSVLVSVNNTEEEMKLRLNTLLKDRLTLEKLGKNARESVLSIFHKPGLVINKYITETLG